MLVFQAELGVTCGGGSFAHGGDGDDESRGKVGGRRPADAEGGFRFWILGHDKMAPFFFSFKGGKATALLFHVRIVVLALPML